MTDTFGFGDRLKEFLIEKSLSSAKFGEQIGVTKATVNGFLRGAHLPNTMVFIKIVEFFNCSADFLLGLTDDYAEKTTTCSVPPFGKRIRAALEISGGTQYGLEKTLNVSGSIVFSWLNDRSVPSVSSLAKISSYTGMTIDALLGREEL